MFINKYARTNLLECNFQSFLDQKFNLFDVQYEAFLSMRRVPNCRLRVSTLFRYQFAPSLLYICYICYICYIYIIFRSTAKSLLQSWTNSPEVWKHCVPHSLKSQDSFPWMTWYVSHKNWVLLRYNKSPSLLVLAK